jgi:nucleoside 2-deoxyribosyltransferase
MVTIYVSASSREKALGVMAFLKNQPKLKRKIEFNTPWVNEPNLPQGEAAIKARVQANLAAIRASDLVIVVSDYDKVPGGKFVEVGFAAALGRPVLVLGRMENMYVAALAHSASYNLEVLAGQLKELIADQFSVKAEPKGIPIIERRGTRAA